MNRERLLELADIIEHQSFPDISFSMLSFRSDLPTTVAGRECNTVACIAGHAVARWAPTEWDDPNSDIGGAACEVLDIWRNDWHELFVPDIDLASIKPAQAAKTLRHFANTGIVDWIGQNPELAKYRQLEQ